MWIGAAIVRGARALARAPLDARLLGVAGGVMVFLITCLTGHPFLVGEAVYPFWMVFGLMSALAASTMLNQSTLDDRLRARADTPPRLRVAAAAIAVVILAASPMAAARARAGMPESQAVHGLYPWETLEDGTPFRWTEQYASVFVPADVTRVEIPVRFPTSGRSVRPMGVEVRTSGVERGQAAVAANWATISVPLPPVLPPTPFKRVDLRIQRVWQPALYIAGSADMRLVGVQVGEPRLFRE